MALFVAACSNEQPANSAGQQPTTSAGQQPTTSADNRPRTVRDNTPRTSRLNRQSCTAPSPICTGGPGITVASAVGCVVMAGPFSAFKENYLLNLGTPSFAESPEQAGSNGWYLGGCKG
ncbi:hypothetical protein [Actinoplanes sp. GCM10030250]|uniref:hypothetical protein n=1 Tax=Actinoplanes sp. GCM10030250 TaxID=3273376 RepID=UPI003622ADE7